MSQDDQKGRVYFGTERLESAMKSRFKELDSSQKAFLIDHKISRTTYHDTFHSEKGATRETLETFIQYLDLKDRYNFESFEEIYYKRRYTKDIYDKSKKLSLISTDSRKNYVMVLLLLVLLTTIIILLTRHSELYLNGQEEKQEASNIEVGRLKITIVPFIGTSGEIDSNYLYEKAFELRFKKEISQRIEIDIVPNDTINRFNMHQVAINNRDHLILFGNWEEVNGQQRISLSWIYSNTNYDNPLYKSFNYALELNSPSDIISNQNAKVECLINQHVGFCYEILNQPEQSMSYYQIAYDHCPDDRRLTTIISANYVKKKNFDLAFQLYKKKLKVEIVNVFDLFNIYRVLEYIKKGGNEPLNLYRVVITEPVPCNFKYPDSLAWLSPDSIIALSNIKLKNPRNRRLLYKLGTYFQFIQNDLYKAEGYYKQFLAFMPRSNDTHSALSSIYRELGLSDKAMFFKKKAYSLEPNPNDLHMIGHLFRDLGNSDSALAYYKRAAQEGAKGQITMDIAKLYAQKGINNKADSTFRVVVQEYPNYTNGIYEYGLFLLKQSRNEKARKIFQNLIETHEFDKYGYLGMYHYYLLKDSLDYASQYIQIALKCDRSSDLLFETGSFLITKLNNPKQAKVYLKEYLERVSCIEEQKVDSNKSVNYKRALLWVN